MGIMTVSWRPPFCIQRQSIGGRVRRVSGRLASLLSFLAVYLDIEFHVQHFGYGGVSVVISLEISVISFFQCDRKVILYSEQKTINRYLTWECNIPSTNLGPMTENDHVYLSQCHWHKRNL